MLLYRGVSTIPATLRDFTSNAAKGRPLKGFQTPKRLDLWNGLSTFDTIEALRQNIADWPSNGPYIALLSVPEDGSFRTERTFGVSHWTLWGEPGDLLRLVIDYDEQ